MKFAPRDGSTARTLAVTAPSGRSTGRTPSAGWIRADAAVSSAPRTSTRQFDGQGSTGASPSAANILHIARGQTIFHPGQGVGMVYIVREGCVRLYKILPDGRSINLALLGPSTVFTQEDLTNGIARGSIAEAMVDSTIAVVELSSLATLISESPSLAAAIVNGASRRLTDLQTLIEHLLVRDTAVRLATTLLSLASIFGRPTADKMTAITIPLTHQALAGMIGSNRVTVTRKLLQLQENGSVRSLGRNALAVDTARLLEYVQEASDSEAA